MSFASHVPTQIHRKAWVALATLFAYYVRAVTTLRLRLERRIAVTEYEPPQGISPAIAAYLVESGRCERAFAAALVSLAEKDTSASTKTENGLC
jgi:transglutaminase-like putative cysteine protease